MSDNTKLAYPMQIGTGTLDPFYGLTYSGSKARVFWGAQSIYTQRVNKNKFNYRFGNALNANLWGGYQLSKGVSANIGLNYKNIGNIEGQDDELNPMMMPLFNAKNSGAEILNLNVGVNSFWTLRRLNDFKVGFTVSLPVYQNFEGIQMTSVLGGVIGAQYVLCH